MENRELETNTNNTKSIPSCYNNNNNMSNCGSSRQSSTRWSPTSEQIRILKELYYNNGVRSPTAEQIQRISAKLRQYGKIEGKNVFYWFQNHKARERQKKRFTTTNTVNAHHDIIMMRPTPPTPQPANYKYQHQPEHHIYYNKFTPTAGGLLGNYGYGSMEQLHHHHRPPAPQHQHNFTTWAGFDPYASFPYGDQTLEMEMEMEMEREEEGEERETLPLFPIHGEMLKQQTSDYGYNGSNYFNATSSRASLELSLSSSYSIIPHHR